MQHKYLRPNRARFDWNIGIGADLALWQQAAKAVSKADVSVYLYRLRKDMVDEVLALCRVLPMSVFRPRAGSHSLLTVNVDGRARQRRDASVFTGLKGPAMC